MPHRPNRSPPAALIALLLVLAPSAAPAEFGNILIEYRASSGVLPEQQGWYHEGECLSTNCPGTVCHEIGDNDTCWWQGCRDLDGTPGMDNSCSLDIGCRKATEQYNAPSNALGVTGLCSYTEWLVFDNGDNFSGRPLTINDAPDAYPQSQPPVVRVVDTPPFGANQFTGAPEGYPPLRLSIGSGSDEGRVLPASTSNNRNGGKVKIRSTNNLGLPPGPTVVTLVARMAFGPWDLDAKDVCVELRIPSTTTGRHWRFGITPPNSIPGHDGEMHLGISNRKLDEEPGDYPFGPLSVRTYDSLNEMWNGGEFYTVHLVCRSDGTWSAFLNEEPTTVYHGSLGTSAMDDSSGVERELQWGIIDRAGGAECEVGCGKTFWLDYIQVLEGEIWPTGCPDPVFDINGDGAVNGDDFDNELDIDFVTCATGPAPPEGVFDTRPRWCKCLDINGDGAVDQTDFAGFQRCLGLTGAALLACDD